VVELKVLIWSIVLQLAQGLVQQNNVAPEEQEEQVVSRFDANSASNMHSGKKNVFSGHILEIQGLPKLKCKQAFEISDASAERSAAGCTIQLDKEPIVEYLNSNVVMLKWMIAEGYGDVRTLERQIACMQEWLANPVLMEADSDAEYFETIEIDLNELKEPILAIPNDLNAIALLSDVARSHIHWTSPCGREGVAAGEGTHSNPSLGGPSDQNGRSSIER
jgi:hypothetical protein